MTNEILAKGQVKVRKIKIRFTLFSPMYFPKSLIKRVLRVVLEWPWSAYKSGNLMQEILLS